jgi:hypothetical protein
LVVVERIGLTHQEVEGERDNPDRGYEAGRWRRLRHAVTDGVTLRPTAEGEDGNTIATAMRNETLGEEPKGKIRERKRKAQPQRHDQ